MGSRALSAAAAGLCLGLLTLAVSGAAEPDPFTAMSVLRVAPPAPAPDLAFEALDGRPARLVSLRGRPVLLTFFTTW